MMDDTVGDVIGMGTNSHICYAAPHTYRMKVQLDVILKDFNYKIHLIIPNAGAGDKATGGYEIIDQVFEGQTIWYSDLSPQDAILHMMNADLLVTSPSSFCSIATTFSAKPVVLFDTPKEGDYGVSQSWKAKVYPFFS